MSDKPTGRRMVLDKELAAMQDIADVLEPLSDDQVKRVLVYIMTRHAPDGMSLSVGPNESAQEQPTP
jgi:hypothetical protein